MEGTRASAVKGSSLLTAKKGCSCLGSTSRAYQSYTDTGDTLQVRTLVSVVAGKSGSLYAGNL